MIPKFLLLKKRLETFLLHYCHTFMKSRHWNRHLFEVLLVWSAASSNPLNMTNKAKRNFRINYFSILLQRLVKASKTSNQSAERVKAQYSSFFDAVDSNVTAFKDFNKENDRLDSFFADFIGRDKSYADMWEVRKIMFTLSHGQSSVECGFTLNKQFSIEHQRKPPKKFKSLEICCITSKIPFGSTKKTFANNGKRKKWKKVIKVEDCWWWDQANKIKVSHPSSWDRTSYN